MGSALVLVLCLSGSRPVDSAPAEGLDRLRGALDEVVRLAKAEIGISVKHLPSGAELALRGEERFPMASTFKLPILVELFNQVDAGRIRLDERVELGPEHLHLGSGLLNEFLVPGVALSLENLSLLMMRVSDNSATDYLLERVGVANVNRRLEKLGIRGISVNRSCQRLILDWMGIDFEKTRGLTYPEVEKMLNDYQPAPGELEEAAARAADDPQDTATPSAMNQLLEKIFKGEAASADSCRRMVDILLKCDTGANRLRGLLPASVQVAHKTGTIGGTVNDVGIIYLPGDRGQVLITVLSKKGKSTEESEKTIANLARYAYDYFLFTAPKTTSAP